MYRPRWGEEEPRLRPTSDVRYLRRFEKCPENKWDGKSKWHKIDRRYGLRHRRFSFSFADMEALADISRGPGEFIVVTFLFSHFRFFISMAGGRGALRHSSIESVLCDTPTELNYTIVCYPFRRQ